MSSTWLKQGHLRSESVNIPSERRLNEGPCAVVECPQQIPCDPCRDVCPREAVSMNGLNQLPSVDSDRCSGCGICVAACPGLAIYLLEFVSGRALLTVPYEFFPLPRWGGEVSVADRQGKIICSGEVVGVRENSSQTKTSLVTVKIPRKKAQHVRWVRRIE